MKHLKISVGLVAVCGLIAVVAPPALASQPKWAGCEESSSGKWTNGLCTTAGSGKWETREITETLETTASGHLELEDSKATGGATAVKCAGSSLGTIGSGGSGGIAKITLTSCNFAEGKHGVCEESKSVTVRAINLPWGTKLEEVENKTTKENEIRSQITSLVSGKEPGWTAECTVSGVMKITDTCEGVDSMRVRANRAEGTLEGEAEEVSAEKPATCSIGGAKSGFIRGGQTEKVVKKLVPLLTAIWLLAPIYGSP